MVRKRHQGARYLELSSTSSDGLLNPKTRSIRKFSVRKLFLQSTVALMAFLVVGSGLQLTALAELTRNAVHEARAVEEPVVGDGREDDGSAATSQKIKEAMEASGFDPTSQDDLANWSKDTKEPTDRNSFKSLFYRIFIPGYLNSTPSGVSTTNSGRTAGCDSPRVGSGTVVYHNCDVPNMTAEVIQDIARFLIPSGAYGASQETVKSVNQSFGFPTGVLPGSGSVPVKESSRAYKYTGLELFGYNLRYTAYLGEWDYIKVFTEARAMSNFGTFDKLKLGGKAIIDGAVASAGNAVAGWNSGWNSGGIAGAVGGFFSGSFEGGVTGSINTILDTSDLNVFEQNAWYRPDFSATTYGARSMNSDELSAESLKQLNAMMNSYAPKTAVLPPDFPPDAGGPARPLEAISSCEVVSSVDGSMTAWGGRNSPPGVTKSACESQGVSRKASLAEDAAKSDAVSKPSFVPYSYDAEGTQAQQSIADWKSANGAYFVGMEKYSFGCADPAEGSRSERAGGINAWYSCLSEKYEAKAKEVLDQEKKKENDKYAESVFGKLAGVFAGWWAAQNQDSNFNAAYNRFVCVDTATGQDIKLNGVSAKVYNSDGSLTGNCNGLRPPIQDGLFGNGYNNSSVLGGSQEVPAQDTRRAQFSPMESFWTAIGNTVAGWSLNISVTITRFSNTILGLAFTPVLDALGIRDVIVSLITSFRESMFFPLSTLMAAFGALTILVKTFRKNAYREAFTSFLYIVIAFAVGVILLTKPAQTLKVVDEAPVLFENTILTAMFGDSSGGDKLCTATGTASGKGKGGETITGAAGFNPNQSIRMLMCENWRTFAFTPWVYGQWGTGFESLYANGYGSGEGNSSLKNTNGELVGNAGVNFGGGQVVHNWATYQLATMSVGTSTSADNSRPTGVTNKNFYRIVDAQMGPNGGAGTDGTYAESWSKFNDDTAAATIFGPIAAGAGAAVVISYSIAKLELVLVSVFLLAILPIMLLIGIHPTFGRQKLKAYGGTLLGLMIQRILLTLLIGMLFKFLFSISAAGTSYLLIAIVSIIVAALFLSYRKEFLGLVQRTMEAAAGSFAGGALYNARSAMMNNLPTSVRNFAAMRREEARGVAFGAIAGMAHGQNPLEMKESLSNIRESYRQRESGAQMIRGLGMGQKGIAIRQEVDEKVDSRYRGSEFADARERLQQASAGYERDAEGSPVQEALLDKNGKQVLDEYGNPILKDKRIEANFDENGDLLKEDGSFERNKLGRKKTLHSGSTRRDLRKIKAISDRIEGLKNKKTRRVQRAEATALRKMGYANIEELEGEDKIKALQARAQLHIDLTRYSKIDGRVPVDGTNAAQDRVGSNIEESIANAEAELESTVSQAVSNGRFMPKADRREATEEAYEELRGLVSEAIDKTTDRTIGKAVKDQRKFNRTTRGEFGGKVDI